MSGSIELFRAAWEMEHSERGYVHPVSIREKLTELGHSEQVSKDVAHTIFRHETKAFLFDGAEETLAGLLDQGDHICIWTDDFIIRVGAAGFADLRKRLPYEERKRIFVSTAEDKCTLLPSLADYAITNSLTNVVVVDDKANNLSHARESMVDASLDPALVLARQIPQHSQEPRMSDISYRQMSNIRELSDLRTSVSRPQGEPVFWIIDFNHTLVDTDALNDSRFAKASALVKMSAGG